MKKIIIATLMMTQLGMLTACTTMNSGFDCPNQAGVSCKSLDQINGMVDSGQIKGRTQNASYQSHDSSLKTNATEFESFSSTKTVSSHHPMRYGETIQRIWIAPFEDSEGNYHAESVVYAVMKGGHWVGQPVKAVHAL